MEELRNLPSAASAHRSRWRTQGWVGLLLIATCWPLNWTLKGVTEYLFFPLWLGYVLVVDALVAARTGSSMWTRSRKEFVLLFVASSPVWWVFEVINDRTANWGYVEVINDRTANWEYLGSKHFTTFEHYLLCTISFSTVMPAVFETAELAGSFKWVERFTFGPRVRETAALEAGFFLAGAGMLLLTLAWPKYCYPFVWTSLVLILEPLNRWLGREHFMEYLERGDWRAIVSVLVGGLI